MSARKPTSLDIAYLAGVSQATVSRALRGSKLVSADTRERVIAVANRLNYRIDRNAANLRSQRTRTLALLLFDDATSDESRINPFFTAMLGSITRAASARGYDLLVSFQKMSEDWHTEYEMANRADGLILLGYGDYTHYGEKLKALCDAKANFVIWGPSLDDHSGRFLASDNRMGAHAATAHLVNMGRRRIAFVGSISAGYPEFAQRYSGYRLALEQAGIDPNPALQVDGHNHEQAGRAAVGLLLESGVAFDALFAASDLMAIGAIQALGRLKRRVPEDIAVVGFDDIPGASYVTPALTTVRQDTAGAGRQLVANLVSLIEGEQPEVGLLPLKLVVRRSCGAKSGD